jgi:hypothetical protein
MKCYLKNIFCLVPPQYAQKYRNSWEKLPAMKGWLQPCTTANKKAYCKYCKTFINAKLGDLNKHRQSMKHKAAEKPFSCPRQQKLNLQPLNKTVTEQQQKEGKTCLFVAAHTSINVVEHLCEIQDVPFHRTKCTNIIKNVVGPYFLNDLLLDIGDKYYSLIIDESTDVTVLKMLGLVIRYFSQKHSRIVCTFLSLVHIENGTAECIVESIKGLLKKYNLDLQKLQGIGTDNASAMVGINGGVFKKLKEDIPHLVLVRCICHSLQLAVSSASETTLPRNIEYLIKETYNWFSNSSIRQLAYQQIYSVINNGEKPLKILQMAATRWISIEPAIKRILEQWDSLKAHFDIVRIKENCYTSEILYSMYKDLNNKVYLEFIYNIVNLVQATNKSFEASNADVTKLFVNLNNLYLTVVKSIVIPTAKINSIAEDFENRLDPNPYLGYAFEKACTDCSVSQHDKEIIKNRCFQLLIELAKQLKQRLCDNIKILEKMQYFSVTECLKPNKMPITDIACQFYANPQTISKIEYQWNSLQLIPWSEIHNTELFWIEVKNYRDASNENPFQNLVDVALRILCLPHSNAEVERVFSSMNIVKNKIRNRMKLDLLNNILNIKYGLKRIGKCCNSFNLPDEVLLMFDTNVAYKRTSDEAENLDVDNILQNLCVD